MTVLGEPNIGAADSPIHGTSGMWFDSTHGINEYFRVTGILEERCGTFISKSWESQGEYNFFFEWLLSSPKNKWKT